MLYLYKPGTYARNIARALDIGTVTVNNKGSFIKRTRKNQLRCDLNWGMGRSAISQAAFLDVLKPDRLASMYNADIYIPVSKVRTFDALKAVNILVPTYSKNYTDINQRGKYLARKDFGTGGSGIEVVECGKIPSKEADFYTIVIAKACEVRIHVFGGRVICEQVKYIPKGSKVLIRSYDNGARFSAKNISSEMGEKNAEKARKIAIDAVAACGIQFGAVDMIMGHNNGGLYVLEVNTAPGISPLDDDQPGREVRSTYESYLNAIEELL